MRSLVRVAVTLLFVPVLASAEEPPRVDAHGDPLPLGAIARLGTTRWRPGGPVKFMAFSADGRQLTTVHDKRLSDTELVVWEVSSGRELHRVKVEDSSFDHWVRLASGRSVSVTCDPRGERVRVLEYMNGGQDPPTRERGVRLVPTKSWPPEGDEHDPRRVHGPVTVTGPASRDGEGYFCFDLSADGRFLAGSGRSGAESGKARPIDVWELTNQSLAAGKLSKRQFALQPDDCNALVFCPGGRTLVALSVAKRGERNKPKQFVAVAWDMATGKERRRFAVPSLVSKGFDSNGDFVFERPVVSDKFLAVYLAREGETVLLFGLEGGQDRRIVTGHRVPGAGPEFGTSILCFAPDGTLVSGGHDGSVKFWDPATGRELSCLPKAYDGSITSLVVSPDGKRLACAGFAGVIRHWDLTTRKEIEGPRGPMSDITGAVLTADGRSAITTGKDNVVRFWDVATGRERGSVALPEPGVEPPSLVLAPDGRTALVACGSRLRAWDAHTVRPTPVPERPGGRPCRGVHLTADGRTMVALHEGAVTLLDWPSGNVRRTIDLPKKDGRGVTRAELASLSPDNRLLALVTSRYSEQELDGSKYLNLEEATIGLWDATTGKHLGVLVWSARPDCAAAFTQSGELFCPTGGGVRLHPRDGSPPGDLVGSFHVIDPASGRVKRSIVLGGDLNRDCWSDGPRGIASILSPDGRSILSADDGHGTVTVYEFATTGKLEISGSGLRSSAVRRELVGHRAMVTVVACAADGNRVITGSSDLTALVWDTSLAATAATGDPPALRDQAELWEKLRHDDARIAYEAMATLGKYPQVGLAVIRAGVKRVPDAPDDGLLDRLVGDLANTQFAVRDKAMHDLERYGEGIVANLSSRRANVASPEARKRIDELVGRFDPDQQSPARLREIRALELLEAMNTPESRALLAELAKGAATARLTREAAASLKRCQQSKGAEANR